MDDAKVFNDLDNSNFIDLQNLVDSFRFENLKNEQNEFIVKKCMERSICQDGLTMSERHNELVTLHYFVTKRLVKPSIMPRDFIQDYIGLFSSPLTNICIKHELLSISNDIMKYCSDFVEKFSNVLYYAKVYDEMRRRNFRVEQCLPVLDQFILHSPVAYVYLSKQGYIEFILESLKNENSRAAISALYTSLKKFTSSSFFTPLDNEELVTRLVDRCIEKIIPKKEKSSFIDCETKIVAPIIVTLSNLLKHMNQECMSNIINYGISLIIVSLLNEEDLELTMAAIDFIYTATYYSDAICIQLQKIDVIQIMLNCLKQIDPENEENERINPLIYSKCALEFLRIIYNTFVACAKSGHESETYIFESVQNEDFLGFLNKTINEGSSIEKTETFSILAIILYFLKPNEVISFANDFCIHNFLQEMIEITDDNITDVYNNLYIAKILAEVSSLSIDNARSLSGFREVMLSPEMKDVLDDIKITQSNEKILECVDFLLKWISDETNEDD